MKELHEELIEMGSFCIDAIGDAVKALLGGDPKYYRENANEVEMKIIERERSIEALCYNLILLQQPVAKDLRLISAAAKMITDIERIGVQAMNIAEISRHIEHSDLKTTSIQEMAQKATAMVTDAIDSFVRQDLELAHFVIRQDDKVDSLFVRTKEELAHLIARNPASSSHALDMLMTAKYFERIGDHAVNIAEWVVFSITGEYVDYR